MGYRPIEETEVYGRASVLSDEVFLLVGNWSRYPQETVGTQLARAVDSIAANLVEGDARGTRADTSRFFIYSRSSAREARHWIRRALARKLIEPELSDRWVLELTEIAKMINALLRYRRENEQTVREPISPYGQFSAEDPFSTPLTTSPPNHPTT